MPFSELKATIARWPKDFRAWSRDSERVLSLVVAFASCAIAITCASASGPTPVAPASSAQPAPLATSSAVPLSSSAASVSARLPTPPPIVPEPPRLALPHFYAQLAALEKKQRQKHVRVLWLGDSHTAADYWSHMVRAPLQKRFGAGGAGIVLVGQKPYRHGAAKVTKDGEWRREPASPSRSDKQLDGVFGLVGVRSVPLGRDAHADITPNGSAGTDPLKFTVLYRSPKADDRVRVKLDGSSKDGDQKSGSAGPAGSPIRRLTVEGKAGSTLVVSAASGAPEIFGVQIEGGTAGVIVETLGVNGARAQTPFAWDQTMWEAEAKALAPSLFIYAYGTNDLVSTLTTERYAKHLGMLVERGRRVAPDADCLFVGPPDMASVEDGKTMPRVIEFDQAARDAAKKLGCGYFSAYDAMGGADSFSRWMKETPPLAAKDRVHLSAAGYERVGKLLCDAILDGYARRK
jgi:lysophospholipase L1-like esterase